MYAVWCLIWINMLTYLKISIPNLTNWTEKNSSGWRRQASFRIGLDLYLFSSQVQNKKQRDTAAQDAEMLAKRKAAEEKGDEKGSDKENAGSADILGEQDDADVIF